MVNGMKKGRKRNISYWTKILDCVSLMYPIMWGTCCSSHLSLAFHSYKLKEDQLKLLYLCSIPWWKSIKKNLYLLHFSQITFQQTLWNDLRRAVLIGRKKLLFPNTLGRQALKNIRLSVTFWVFYSVIAKLGTTKELVILWNPMFFVFEIFAFLAGKWRHELCAKIQPC